MQEPLIGATVAVWRQRDTLLVTGSVTDGEGRFAIDGVAGGRYRVVISSVGYEMRTFENVRISPEEPRVDLGTVGLLPEAALLGDVVVEAGRDRVEFQVDRTVYNVADDPIALSGSVTDLLETLPSVDVDVEGNVSLRGTGNVAILINGRPAPISAEFVSAYLQQLPAGMIESIEIIPNPSAQFRSDGMGGIINIVLKENASLGIAGTVRAGADTDGGYEANAMLTFGRGPLTMAASYGLRQNERLGLGSRYRINRYADPLTYLLQESESGNAAFSHFVNLSGDYALGQRSTLNSSVQFGLRNSSSLEEVFFRELDDSELLTNQYLRTTNGDGRGWNADARIGFRHDFDGAPRGGGSTDATPSAGQGRGMRGGGGGGGGGRRGSAGRVGGSGHSISADLRWSQSGNDSADLYDQQAVEGYAMPLELRRTESDQSQQTLTAQLDYSRPILGVNMSVGYRGEIESLANTFYSETQRGSAPGFSPDTQLNNAFEYNALLNAGYLQAGRDFGPLGVQVGVRLESAQTRFTLLNTNEAYENNFLNAFPSASAALRLSPFDAFRASYSRRVRRPGTRFLNPFPRFQDPLNLSVGNPALRPQFTNSFDLGYTRFLPWGSVAVSPYYRHTTDIIRRYETIREDGVTVRTFENLATSSSYGVEGVLSFEMAGALRGLRGFASIEGYRVQTDGTALEADLQSDAFGWGGRANLSYGLATGTDIQATFRHRAPIGTEQGRSGAFTMVDLALRQRLFDGRANLAIRARDPLGLSGGFSSVVDRPDLFQTWERTMGRSQVGFTFTYTFGRTERREQDRPDGREGEFSDIDLM